MGAAPPCTLPVKAVFRLGRSSKSKRFVHQGKDAVKKYSERFPYHSTLAEAEANRSEEGIPGGIL